MEYLSINELRENFADYLMKYQYCTPSDARMIAQEFPDPYTNPYLQEEWIGTETINGEKYQSYASCVDFSMFYSFSNALPYRFYTYYLVSDLMPNRTVGDYRKARKLFALVPLAEINDDFPLQPDFGG